MRTFQMPPFAAAIIFSVLVMGAIGLFIVVPIVGIFLSWNLLIAHNLALPHIQLWQAGLLYIAMACIAYLSGWVQIEVKAELPD